MEKWKQCDCGKYDYIEDGDHLCQKCRNIAHQEDQEKFDIR